MGKIKIKNETIEYKERILKVDELLFWPENPRVYSALRMKSDNPTQKEIEDIMTSLENVKRLRQSIIANGGLTHPIFVRDNVVIEGNSRLAAYRILCRTDKIKWGQIRCNILPTDLSDDLVFALIGSIHINGVTEWTPFEQAGYLYRHLQKSKKPIEIVAKDCGLQPKAAKLYVKVYETMIGNEDTDQSRWSYYFEMLKNNSIPEASQTSPNLNLIDKLCEKIKDGSIEKATDLRKIGKLAASKNKEAKTALKSYLEGKESLETAVSKVSEDDKKKHLNDITRKFREQLKDRDFVKQLIESDESYKYEITRIFQRLNNILNN